MAHVIKDKEVKTQEQVKTKLGKKKDETKYIGRGKFEVPQS